MKLTETTTIPLREAYICGDMDCQTIGKDPHRCPLCHSHVMSLARLLDRKEQA
jgi:hypothetical protein